MAGPLQPPVEPALAYLDYTRLVIAVTSIGRVRGRKHQTLPSIRLGQQRGAVDVVRDRGASGSHRPAALRRRVGESARGSSSAASVRRHRRGGSTKARSYHSSATRHDKAAAHLARRNPETWILVNFACQVTDRVIL